MSNASMRVDLSNFINDARKNTLIWIDECWTNINDVQDHIQKLFRLTNVSLVTQDDCYLSPKESIKVLQSVESLKAFTLNALCSSNEESVEASTMLCVPGKKRKNRSSYVAAEFSSSTPNCPKRSKSTNHSETKTDKPQSQNSSKNKSKTQTTVFDDIVVDDDMELEDVELAESSKQKTFEKSDANHKTWREKRSETTRETSSKLKSINVESSCNNHIIYTDVEEEDAGQQTMETEQLTEQTTAEASRVSINVPQVEFRCAAAELDLSVPRIFELPRSTVEILEDIVIPAPTQESKQSIAEPLEAQAATDIGFKEAKVPDELNTTDSPSTTIGKEPDAEIPSPSASKVIEEQSLLESDSEDDIMVLEDTTIEEDDIMRDMMENAAPLTDLPNVGENIIFKLTKVKGAPQQSPQTDYIAGTCSYINRRTKSITISVIACGSVSKNQLRSYMSNLDDSSDGTVILNVNFRELIDAKVIVSTVD